MEALWREMEWLQAVIDQVIRTYLIQEGHEKSWLDIPLPEFENLDTPFAEKVNEWQLNKVERLALSLALAPHIKPEVLDIFFGKNAMYDRGFTEFGGVIDKSHSGFLPTGQTLVFLATSVHAPHSKEVYTLLSPESFLIRKKILTLAEVDAHLPAVNGMLGISTTWLHYFITGENLRLEYSSNFPAQVITTKLEWEDVVLDPKVMEQVEEILTWLQHGDVLLDEWGLSRHLKPGYRALFFGPPGTGKTLTATLLGKVSRRDVYRVDLSMLVSKYIGETEKNLARVFDIAETKNWILFFDEADALFGKRTSANSSNDRHANQQTSYLLQRIEDYNGVVILASNLKANMDEAFMRRFQTVVHFDMPGADERIQLWKQAFSGKCVLDEEIDLHELAEEFEIAGGAIINVLRYCALRAIQRNSNVVSKAELVKAIRREFKKENRVLNVTENYA